MRTAFHAPRIGHHVELAPMAMLALQGFFLLAVSIAVYAYASTL